MISLEVKLPHEVASQLAANVKQRRLELNLTQAGLASRAGIKLPTYRKFERTGMISLFGLLRIAFALDCLDEFTSLFTRKRYETLADVINENTRPPRKRGKHE